MQTYSSRLPGFFELAPKKRRELLCQAHLDSGDFLEADQGLTLDEADSLSENVIATFSLPMAVAANFIIDDEPVLIPMVTEEPSIVAACSKMAKIVGLNKGFYTKIDEPLILGQIQVYDLRDVDHALNIFKDNQADLLEKANSFCPNMKKRGGGVMEINARVLPSEKIGAMLLIEPLMNVADAMGANAINTVLEGLAVHVAKLFDGKIGLRILSNFCDKRMAEATCEIPFRNLAKTFSKDDGLEVAQKIIAAHALAEVDIYRATTHNKGIMNGIDAIALATGNDFRAIEAGVHAFASLNGYKALTSLEIDLEKLCLKAKLTLPLAVGVVGGITQVHRGVKLAHKILGDASKSAKKLASVMVSVGLSQCLAALFALSQEGIQRGHMKLHHKKDAKRSDVCP